MSTNPPTLAQLIQSWLDTHAKAEFGERWKIVYIGDFPPLCLYNKPITSKSLPDRVIFTENNIIQHNGRSGKDVINPSDPSFFDKLAILMREISSRVE